MFKSISKFIRQRRTRKSWEKKGFVSRRRHSGKSQFAAAAERSPVLGCFMLILIWGTCSLLLTLSNTHNMKLGMLVVGQQAPETINAAFNFHYLDEDATRKAQLDARHNEPLFFALSEKENVSIKRNFNDFFAAAEYRATPDAPTSRPVADSLAAKLAGGLNGNTLNAIVRYAKAPSSFRYFENELNSLLSGGIMSAAEKASIPIGQKIRLIDIMKRERLPRPLNEIPTEDIAAENLATALMKFHPVSADSVRLRKELSIICRALIGNSGNLIFDKERTDEGRKLAVSRIGTVNGEIKKLHPIIRKGDVITEQLLDRLRKYSELNARHEIELGDWKRPLQNMFWSITLVILAGFYLYHIHPEVASSNRRISIVGSAVLVSLLCNYAGIELFNWMSSQSQALPASLIIDAVPLALIAVLMAVFLGFRVAMCTGFFVASVTALMLDLSFEFTLKGLVISSLAALAVRNATNYRSFFMRTAGAVFPLVWLLNSNILFSENISWQLGLRMVLQSGALALGNALATAILALLLIFVYEILFNVTTNMSLMLLCDYNHPLLERLKREAPGTFFHSLMVATLAEDAARSIDANYLRAKAGALYHDIGKLSKPQYFTENNQGVNMHTDLTPQMSSIIIRDHVKEGLKLAREYKLSKVIRDAIEQHHGNDFVHFFYMKAQEQSKLSGEEVQENQFRYQGTPPQTKEAAIISLADACEAACRSLDKPSAGRIEALVDDIFLKRFQNGQLMESDISLAELEKIRESFVNTLLSMKHGRIAYDQKKSGDDDEDDLFMAAAKRRNSES